MWSLESICIQKVENVEKICSSICLKKRQLRIAVTGKQVENKPNYLIIITTIITIIIK